MLPLITLLTIPSNFITRTFNYIQINTTNSIESQNNPEINDLDVIDDQKQSTKALMILRDKLKDIGMIDQSLKVLVIKPECKDLK